MQPSTRFVLLLLLFILGACTEKNPVTPKPRAYPKVEYPDRSYQTFDSSFCAFSFQYPTYAKIVDDDSRLAREEKNPCSFDMVFPVFKGRLNCTYKQVNAEKSIEELRSDAFELADYHHARANYIDELRVDRTDQNVEGLIFAIDGPAATPFQFFLTDKKKHFFRGSLYFNTEIQPDSIGPVFAFIREDLMKMIETFEWTQ